MKHPLDASDFLLPKTDTQPQGTSALPRTGKERTKSIEPFLRGPIPLWWIQTAAALPGVALHLGNALWYLAGMEGHERIRVTTKLCAAFGCKGRHAKYRALNALQKAGLVSLHRGRGKAIRVDIIRERPPQPSLNESIEKTSIDVERQTRIAKDMHHG